MSMKEAAEIKQNGEQSHYFINDEKAGVEQLLDAAAATHLDAWEVVVAEDHLVRVIVVIWEQALGAQEVVAFHDQALTDLQREDVLLGVRRDDASADILSRGEQLATMNGQHLVEPFFAPC